MNYKKITISLFLLFSLMGIVSGCSKKLPSFEEGAGGGLTKEQKNIETEKQINNSPLERGEGVGNDKPCTLEAKICPDGSSVGRIGPNCEFAPCLPNKATSTYENNIASSTNEIDTSDWKTYGNEELGIEFKYPKYLKVEDNGISLSINYDLKEIYNNQIINITFQITPKSIEDQIQHSFGDYPYNIDVIANKIYKVDSSDKIKSYIKNGDYTIIISTITPEIITANDLPPSEIKSIYNKLINTFEIFDQSKDSINKLYKKDINYVDPAMYDNLEKKYIIKEEKLYYVDYNNSGSYAIYGSGPK